MISAIETPAVHLIGAVNWTAFHLSRRRVVLYRGFRGLPGLMLTIIGPRTPTLRTVPIAYLPDGNDYIVLVSRNDGAHRDWEAELLGARPDDVITVELSGRSFEVEIMKLDPAESSRTLGRILKQATLAERYEVRRQAQTPLVRLRELAR